MISKRNVKFWMMLMGLEGHTLREALWIDFSNKRCALNENISLIVVENQDQKWPKMDWHLRPHLLSRMKCCLDIWHQKFAETAFLRSNWFYNGGLLKLTRFRVRSKRVHQSLRGRIQIMTLTYTHWNKGMFLALNIRLPTFLFQGRCDIFIRYSTQP